METTGDRHSGEALFAAMATGIAGVTALIAAMSVVGEWWALAATFGVLVATTIAIVLMISARLAETGDPEPQTVALATSPAQDGPPAVAPATRPAMPLAALTA